MLFLPSPGKLVAEVGYMRFEVEHIFIFVHVLLLEQGPERSKKNFEAPAWDRFFYFSSNSFRIVLIFMYCIMYILNKKMVYGNVHSSQKEVPLTLYKEKGFKLA